MFFHLRTCSLRSGQRKWDQQSSSKLQGHVGVGSERRVMTDAQLKSLSVLKTSRSFSSRCYVSASIPKAFFNLSRGIFHHLLLERNSWRAGQQKFLPSPTDSSASLLRLSTRVPISAHCHDVWDVDTCLLITGLRPPTHFKQAIKQTSTSNGLYLLPTWAQAKTFSKELLLHSWWQLSSSTCVHSLPINEPVAVTISGFKQPGLSLIFYVTSIFKLGKVGVS